MRKKISLWIKLKNKKHPGSIEENNRKLSEPKLRILARDAIYVSISAEHPDSLKTQKHFRTRHCFPQFFYEIPKNRNGP